VLEGIEGVADVGHASESGLEEAGEDLERAVGKARPVWTNRHQRGSECLSTHLPTSRTW
jgi:hypothetical protein